MYFPDYIITLLPYLDISDTYLGVSTTQSFAGPHKQKEF